MAGPRCKIILNGIVQGLIRSLENVLTNDSLMAEVDETKRNDWLQRLANCDLAVYNGNIYLLPKGGLCAIVSEMEDACLVTDEIWYVLRKPTN